MTPSFLCARVSFPSPSSCRTQRDAATVARSAMTIRTDWTPWHEQLSPHRPADRFPDATVGGGLAAATSPIPLVVEGVDGLDLRAMSGAYRGSGSASYHQAVLLNLLVYGYATGCFPVAGWSGRRMIPLPSASSPRMTTRTTTRLRRSGGVSSRRSRHCSSSY